MMNSAATCRKQEALHRSAAQATALDNVRQVALTAAAAWEQEAIWAEKLESRKIDQLSPADAEIAREMQAEDDEPDDAPDDAA